MKSYQVTYAQYVIFLAHIRTAVVVVGSGGGGGGGDGQIPTVALVSNFIHLQLQHPACTETNKSIIKIYTIS